MQHPFVNTRINSCTTSCEIWVKIGAVTSEFKRAKVENLPRLGMQFDDHRLFGMLAF